jgi:hypothetical protein
VEGLKLKGIIPKWGELSRNIEDGRFHPNLSSFLGISLFGKIQCFFQKFLELPHGIAGV